MRKDLKKWTPFALMASPICIDYLTSKGFLNTDRKSQTYYYNRRIEVLYYSHIISDEVLSKIEDLNQFYQEIAEKGIKYIYKNYLTTYSFKHPIRIYFNVKTKPEQAAKELQIFLEIYKLYEK